MNKKIASLLVEPTAEYRGKPFWAWNGELKKEELFKQIDIFKEMGFGGFFMHARTGLKTEYLGEKWFELIRECALYAQRLGLEAWLYDEDRWPSGTCGGSVTRERKYRLRFVSLYASEQEAFACKEVVSVLCRYAVLLEKEEDGEEVLLDFYSVKSEEEVKAGYTYAVFAEEEQKPTDFYNGTTYIDAMNAEATALFIESTHEKYAEHCGDLFGSAIKGIFTDEPHRGPIFSGFTIANENRMKMTPWTAKLPETYRKKYGKELQIPLIYWRKKDDKFNSTAEAYIDVMDDLFTQNFAKPCGEWCKAHNLILTGHILHEDSLSVQTNVTGSCMRYYEYMEYPGIDILTEENRAYWAAKQCSSAARQLGKKFVLSELYGATGWDMTLERYKEIGDWQALFGVNFRCQHISMYTMEGEAKRDYPASILHQNAWYKDWKPLEDYFARLSVLSAEGERVADTLVVTPLREMWGKVRLGWMDGLFPQTEEAKDLDEAYIARFNRLIEKNIDFDYGDEEIIRKFGCVEKENGITYLKVGKVRYSEVLWNSAEHVGAEAREIIERFAAEGGRLTNDEAELMPAYRLTMPKELGYTLYKIGEDFWLFALNLDRKKQVTGNISDFGKLDGYQAELWDFRAGKPVGKYDLTEGTIPVELCGGEELIVRFTKDMGYNFKGKTKEYAVPEYPSEFAYELTEQNVLPLDEAVWEQNGILQNGGEKKNILHIDCGIRREQGRHLRGGEMLQPWFVKKYADKTGGAAKLCALKLMFEFNVELLPETPVYLAKERSRFDCFVNGKKIKEKSERNWADSCFEVFPIVLREGVNQVELVGDFYENDGLEAVYILGGFGVRLPDVVCALPEKLKRGDIAAQGLPYYSGSIKYHTGIKGGRVALSFENLSCFDIKIHGGETEKLIAFKPYRAELELKEELVIETVFNRHNTFGPLHQTYPQNVCAPESFLTEGEEYVPFKPMPQGFPIK